MLNYQHISIFTFAKGDCLHCALSLAAQCIVIGPVCGRVCNGRASGRAVSEPYYSQRARSVCVSLSAFFHLPRVCLFVCLSVGRITKKFTNYDNFFGRGRRVTIARTD